ncbi:MAG: hypothetical protein WCA46_25670 [Actinocatenispora sp.]
MSRGRVTRGVALAAVLAAGLVAGPIPAAVAAPHHVGAASTVAPSIGRSEVLARAQSWIDAGGYPYSQSDYTPDGWRTDCSGYVSMAWNVGFDVNGGTNTVGLLDYSTRIDKEQLQPGDILLDANGTNVTRHVVLFEKWADDAHNSYWAYEQSGSGDIGTKHRVVPYPYDSTPDEYLPYHGNDVTDG